MKKHSESKANEQTSQQPANPDRRRALGGLTAALVGGATLGSLAGCSGNKQTTAQGKTTAQPVDDQALKDNIDNIVVIFAENRSFNNLFADFPGLQSPLAAMPAEQLQQRDRNGERLPHLPPIWGGLVPHEQVVEHTRYRIDEQALDTLPNAPFELRTPDGEPLPQGIVTRDCIHAFYQNQMQINGGKNDGFVAWGDSGALVMGRYGDNGANMRLWQLAREFTLCDNFFMGAFGGSFLNHQYLVAARPPFYPNAKQSPAAGLIAQVEGNDPTGYQLKQKASSPASALTGEPHFVPSKLTPDYYAVNTMLPPYAPTYQLDPARPGYADANNKHTMVPQHHKTIGDVLSAKNIDWAWYAGGWGSAMAGEQDMQSFPGRPNFQPHHQPFNYFSRFAPHTAARAQHLRDGGVGDSVRSNHFLADAAAGTLPPVTFYKPQGNLNMHAGYSDVDAGDRHIASVVEVLRNSPQWQKMLVVVTFDENGGWWDHVAPPKGDRWGPGSRIPAVLLGPHVKKGHVDHTVYDTGSIARFITRRFNLERLPGLIEREKAMLEASGVVPGDLTGALQFS